MNASKKLVNSRRVTSLIAAILLVALSPTTFTSCTSDEVRRGAWGAGGGALIGGILGGGRGAAAGAIAGGLIGAGTSPSRYYPPMPPRPAYGYYPY